MSIIISILGAIFAFFIVVLVHEYGHFLVARWMGIKVLRFAIGFGKPVFAYRAKSGVEYAVGFLPLGGYVKMQDAFSESDPDVSNTTGSSGVAFEKKSVWARALVVIAGPLFNLMLATFIFMIIYSAGITYIKPVIGKVAPHSIAAYAHLKKGDEIIQVGNWKTKSWASVVMQLIMHVGDTKSLPMVVLSQRPHHARTHYLNVRHWKFDPAKPDLLQSIGITSYFPENQKARHHIVVTEKHIGFFAILPAIQQVKRWVVFHFVVIKQMIVGHISLKALSGPIGVFSMAGSASLSGMIIYLQFIAFISIVLGVINILPIPALDGGHLLFCVIESVIRRPLSPRVQLLLTNIGVIFLVTLMVYATINDVIRVVY